MDASDFVLTLGRELGFHTVPQLVTHQGPPRKLLNSQALRLQPSEESYWYGYYRPLEANTEASRNGKRILRDLTEPQRCSQPVLRTVGETKNRYFRYESEFQGQTLQIADVGLPLSCFSHGQLRATGGSRHLYVASSF